MQMLLPTNYKLQTSKLTKIPLLLYFKTEHHMEHNQASLIHKSTIVKSQVLSIPDYR